MQILSIGKKKRIHAIAFSPSGEELAAVCGDHHIRIWNLGSGEIRLSTPIEGVPHAYDVTYLDFNRLLFSGPDLRWWDTATNQWHVITSEHSWGRQIAVSPNAEFLAEVDQTRSTELQYSGGLLVRTTTDWALQPTMPDSENTTGGVAFSCDGRLLATGHMESVGRRTRTFRYFPDVQLQQNDYDYLVHVREMPTGRILQSLGGWQQAVTHLAFSPDGAVLAGTAGPRLRIWDLASDREVARHKRGTKHFQGISFARDGSFLATVSNDETARIWNARTWEEHTTFTWEIGKLLNIAFAPDGLRVAAGSESGQIVIWDVE